MSKDIRQVIVCRRDLNMRKGKIAAQAAHASMKFVLDKMERIDGQDNMRTLELSLDQLEWLESGHTKICVSVDSEEELLALIEKGREAKIVVHSIIDSGRTEFNGVPTLTCAAFGPDLKEKLDPLTGSLKLL